MNTPTQDGGQCGYQGEDVVPLSRGNPGHHGEDNDKAERGVWGLRTGCLVWAPGRGCWVSPTGKCEMRHETS